jgi:hypothetical protein
MENLSEIITSVGIETGMLLGAVVGGIVIHGISTLKTAYSNRKDAKRESIPSMVETDVEIYKLLSEILLKSKASRASVFQFHNGTHYVNSASQMKISCTHEVVADGISKEAKNMQNMLISQYAKIVNDIISKPYTVIDVGSSDSEDFIQILRSQGVESAVYTPFYRGTDIEGFISLSYLDPLVSNFPGESNNSIEGILSNMISECSLKIGYLLRKQH